MKKIIFEIDIILYKKFLKKFFVFFIKTEFIYFVKFNLLSFIKKSDLINKFLNTEIVIIDIGKNKSLKCYCILILFSRYIYSCFK